MIPSSITIFLMVPNLPVPKVFSRFLCPEKAHAEQKDLLTEKLFHVSYGG